MNKLATINILFVWCAKILELEEFHDDSQKQINDFIQKQDLPTPFKLKTT